MPKVSERQEQTLLVSSNTFNGDWGLRLRSTTRGDSYDPQKGDDVATDGDVQTKWGCDRSHRV